MKNQNNQPLISITTPVYNSELYLDKCLQSIKNQTYKNFEALIINNGCTDGSKDIIERYTQSDSRFKCITFKENQGVIPARNAGLKNSTGDFIITVDSDDFVHPQFLEILYSGIIKENADVSVCPFIKFTDEKTLGETSTTFLNPNELTSEDISDSRWQHFFSHDCFWVPWNKLVKRNLAEGLEFKNPLSEDFDIFFNIFKRAEKIVITQTPLIFYRQHQNNLSKTQRSAGFQYHKERLLYFLPYFLYLYNLNPDNITMLDQWRTEWRRMKQDVQTEEEQEQYLQLKNRKDIQTLFLPDLILEY